MTAVRLAIRDVGSYGGIGRYVAELVSGLSESAAADVEITVLGERRSPWARDAAVVPVRSMPLGGSLALLRLPRDGRVTHFPLHESTPAFAALRGPVVMTVHSVEPLYLPRPELSAPGAYPSTIGYRLLRSARRKLARVITPSEFERDMIALHLRVPHERIDAIPHGVRSDVFAPGDAEAARVTAGRRFGLDRPYLLYVGHHQPQKNVVTLLRAFAALDRRDVVLAIAGDTARCAATYAEAARGADGIAYLGPVYDDHVLAELYRGALGFCFPSLHESFGLPALEAMAAGCPVAAARGSGLEETVGEAALLFDPRSVEDLGVQLATLIDDDATRERLREAGIARAAAFTWQRSVERHLEAYRRAAG